MYCFILEANSGVGSLSSFLQVFWSASSASPCVYCCLSTIVILVPLSAILMTRLGLFFSVLMAVLSSCVRLCVVVRLCWCMFSAFIKFRGRH